MGNVYLTYGVWWDCEIFEASLAFHFFHFSFFHLCVWEKENLEPGPLFFAFYYDDYEVAFIWGHIQIWRDFRKIFFFLR